MERDAYIHLLKKTISVKSVLHYDTTHRKSIDGEWPAILLNFTDGNEFVLRPLVFTYEDREQIADLLIECLTRLANAASVETKSQVTANIFGTKSTPLQLMLR